ncbi:MAG TPA: TonB family protein [Opitutaceae bacterium]|nr:TonB family protein [Opitutaceae bacterium]HND61620.1 TonB family protein [Opitutaceae bacterium]
MKTLSLLRALVGLTALGIVSLARAEVVLACRIGEKDYPVAGLEHGHAYVVIDGKRTAVPADPVWSLQGDLKANADQFSVSPSYVIRWRPVPDGGAGRETDYPGWSAGVSLRFWREDKGEKGGGENAFRPYPKGVRQEALVVAAWIVDGKVTAVQAQRVPGTSRNQTSVAYLPFPLTEGTRRGRPVLALWQEGTFDRPKPLWSDPALEIAVARLVFDDVEPLRAWLRGGGNPNAATTDGTPLLAFAAEAGNTEAVDLLLQAGAKPTGRGDMAGAPLLWAASHAREQVVASLLAAKAKPDWHDASHRTALTAAVAQGSLAVVRQLIAAHADLDVRSNDQNVPVTLALETNNADIMEELLKAGAEFSFEGQQLERVLAYKVAIGQVEIARLLIRHGVNPRAVYNRATLLMVGARAKTGATMARLLLEAGVDPSQVIDGGTALHVATYAGNASFVQELIKAGANVNLPSGDGATPLFVAAYRNSGAIVTMLVKAGADASHRDARGANPLDAALLEGAADAVASLAQEGLHVTLNAKFTDDVLDALLRLDRADLLERALADGRAVDAPLWERWPLAWVASRYAAKDCLKLLAAKGVSTDAGALTAKLFPVAHPSTPPRPNDQVRVNDPRDGRKQQPRVDFAIRAVVDTDGRVRFAVVNGAVAPGDEGLARIALRTVQRRSCTAARDGDRPVALDVPMPFTFPASLPDAFDWKELDVYPMPIKRVSPVYPPNAARGGQPGVVTVESVIGVDGSVSKIAVVDSSGEEFDDAAVAAIAKWKFKPGEIDGKPVRARIVQPIVFAVEY